MNVVKFTTFSDFGAADGKTVGLIAAALWVDVATAEAQGPSVRRRVSTCRPEEAVRALVHRRAGRLIDVASIRKREWELGIRYYLYHQHRQEILKVVDHYKSDN